MQFKANRERPRPGAWERRTNPPYSKKPPGHGLIDGVLTKRWMSDAQRSANQKHQESSIQTTGGFGMGDKVSVCEVGQSRSQESGVARVWRSAKELCFDLDVGRSARSLISLLVGYRATSDALGQWRVLVYTHGS